MSHDYSNPCVFFRLLALRGALNLEIQGLQMGQQQVSKTVKDEFGFTGKAPKILEALEDLIETCGYALADKRYSPRSVSKEEVLESFSRPRNSDRDYFDDMGEFAMVMDDFPKGSQGILVGLSMIGYVMVDTVNDEYNVFYLTEAGLKALEPQSV